MSAELRWGVVGAGGIARKVIADLALLPGSTLAAVCSRSRDRAAAFAAEFATPVGTLASAHSDVEEMLGEIDVLYVATPHSEHHAAALAALRAGVAVLCEKALTVELADARDLVRESQAQQTFLMEAVWMRFNPLHVRLRRLIADGELGEVRRVSADFSFQLPFDPAHRLFDPAVGGGTLLDMGVYPVSFIQSLLGDPDSVDAHLGYAPSGVEDSATLLLRYPDGVSGISTSTLRADGPRTASVIGTRGRVEIDATFLLPERMVLYRDGREPLEIIAEIEGIGYVPELREVAQRIAAGDIESPVMSHADSLSTLAILRSAMSR